jgi:nucleoside-diphosphate-sugar epimerase
VRIFLAGGAGAIGRRLVPLLVRAGHDVTATTRSETKADSIRDAGAEPVVLDALDAAAVERAVVAARPEVVLHQLTAIPERIDPLKAAEQLAPTNRLRTEATRHLRDAAIRAGARRLIAQSIAFAHRPGGGGTPKTEDDPLYVDAPESFRSVIEAVAELEATTTASSDLEGVVLRYGLFYGPGTIYAPGGSFHEDVTRRRVPIVGDGDGVFSFVHVDDAAAATVAALDAAPGVYQIVDDDPAPVRDWLPVYAELLGVKAPYKVPTMLARLGAGDYGIHIMTAQAGASNARAKSALGWTPRFSSWREGFREMLAGGRSR